MKATAMEILRQNLVSVAAKCDNELLRNCYNGVAAIIGAKYIAATRQDIIEAYEAGRIDGHNFTCEPTVDYNDGDDYYDKTFSK